MYADQSLITSWMLGYIYIKLAILIHSKKYFILNTHLQVVCEKNKIINI